MSEDLHLFVVDELKRAWESGGKAGWEDVAKTTGISYHTILKIARRQIVHPKYRTLKPLIEHFRAHPADAVAH